MKVKISLLLGSAHEVTIVLFSRTFYDAKHLSEFPPYMQDCLQEVRPSRYNYRYLELGGTVLQINQNCMWIKTDLDHDPG
jgi:hypothetical protein